MIKQPWKLLGFIWALPVTLISFFVVLFLFPKWYRLEKEDWSLHFRCNPSQFSVEKARRVLGYAPQVDFAEGMRRTEIWLQNEGYLRK